MPLKSDSQGFLVGDPVDLKVLADEWKGTDAKLASIQRSVSSIEAPSHADCGGASIRAAQFDAEKKSTDRGTACRNADARAAYCEQRFRAEPSGKPKGAGKTRKSTRTASGSDASFAFD